jgi:hypothetical protein
MLIQCCVCKRFRQGARWRDKQIPKRSHEAVSHSYCPVCAQKLLLEMEIRKGRRNTPRPSAA